MFLPLLALSMNLDLQGRTFIRADGANGSDNPRRGRNRPYATLQAAVNGASAGDVIICAPGQYDETVTIGPSKSQIVIIGGGGRGAAFIEPSTEDADGLIVNADDVTLVNLGVAAEDTTAGNYAATVTGARFRAFGCKFEGGEYQLVIGPGTVAQEAAGTHGDAGDGLVDDCEFTWGTGGILLKASDYGAVTQFRCRNSLFRNLSASSFEESDGTGGSAAVHFQDLLIDRCTFGLNEGAVPTKWISLNDDNANYGQVQNCNFPTALNSGKNLVSTALLWTNNYHLAALSNGQPS